MKLVTLINRLAKARFEYVKKYGIEPSIYDVYEGQMQLCATVKKPCPGTKLAKKPYAYVGMGMKSLNS
jgi:hypothetical protein